jgi:hypothetical protein
MKLSRLLLAAVLTGCMAGLAYVGQQAEPSGAKMGRAAEKFLDTLTADQKAKAVVDFDDKERTNWHFTPRQDRNKKYTRKGLPLEEMRPEQKQAALDLLKSGTSPEGGKTATTIMSLEAILRDLEKGGAMVRNPDWYFFTIFGKPSAAGKWGWRVEGHHLSLNFTMNGTKLVASTPAFFGANPATVMGGSRAGLRTLADEDDLAKELFQSLDAEQKKLAQQNKDFPEIREEKTDAGVGDLVGLASSLMSEKQRELLTKLLRRYTERMPEDVAQIEFAKVKNAGPAQIYFAYTGGVEAGKPHTYRIQGPTFVVEFLNVQADSARNPANHIHSVWRNIKGDFGL